MRLNFKRVLSALLAAGMLSGLLTGLPALAAESEPAAAFRDITDAAQAEAADILRVLGVVEGSGSGAFYPGRQLSRAEFCKMTVEIMDNGDKVAAQMNRTVFRDVASTHWARGYINVAATPTSGVEGASVPGIIRGDAYGNFNPDRAITTAEAVTILMRTLGYGDTDVGAGGKWYSGYLATAASLELTEGVTAGAEEAISRGQAAVLFRNLLFTELKGSDSVYLTRLGGSLTADAVILSTGDEDAVETSLETYRTERSGFPEDLQGTRGRLALDEEGKLVAILPKETDTYLRLTLASNNADHVTGVDEKRVELKSDLTVWKDGEATTYGAAWPALKAGDSLLLCYNSAGKNEYLFLSGQSTEDDVAALVLKTAPNGSSNPFASLGSGAALYKNGAAATAADLRQYDVGVYDPFSRTVQVSDRRLTGIYENASPNTVAPATITVMGHAFPVLSSAIADLRSFEIGDRVTLLLTHDNRVAGVVTPSAATATAVGVARVSAGSSQVTLFDGSITLSGENSLSEASAAALDGKLVTVSSGRKGYLSLSRVTGSSVTGTLDLAAGTMGARKLAPNVRFYDSVDGGAVTEVEREDITLTKIPANKIAFLSLDYAGRIAWVVFDNVTGDCYQYGFFEYTKETQDDYDLSGNKTGTSTRSYIALRRGDGEGKETVTGKVVTLTAFRHDAAGGLAIVNGKLAGHVELTALKRVHRADFDVDGMTLTTTDQIWPIMEAVQCWNETTGEWYVPGEEGLAAALAFSEELTVYYDKKPDQGGKIRLIVAE